MSVDASVDLRVVLVKRNKIIAPIEAINQLINNGWSLQLNKYIRYLPLGCNDSFDCIDEIIDYEDLWKILESKQERSELIVISLFLGNSGIGGSLLLWSEEKVLIKKVHTPIVFSLNINRKKTNFNTQFRFTDFNWYLEKIMPAFNNDDMYVEYFTCEEHI